MFIFVRFIFTSFIYFCSFTVERVVSAFKPCRFRNFYFTIYFKVPIQHKLNNMNHIKYVLVLTTHLLSWLNNTLGYVNRKYRRWFIKCLTGNWLIYSVISFDFNRVSMEIIWQSFRTYCPVLQLKPHVKTPSLVILFDFF